MRFLRVFRVPKHTRYNYIPQYYDPDKEALQERLKDIERQSEDTADGMKRRIASGLKSGYGDSSYRKKTILRSNVLVLGIVFILIALSVLFINYYLPRILESL